MKKMFLLATIFLQIVAILPSIALQPNDAHLRGCYRSSVSAYNGIGNEPKLVCTLEQSLEEVQVVINTAL